MFALGKLTVMFGAALAALIAVATAAPSASPQPAGSPPDIPRPMGSGRPIGSPCLSDAQVDGNIDPRLPPWMRTEIRDVMMHLPPCARGGKVGSADRQGRAIFNDYDDYLAYRREWGGDWKRVDERHWETPSGLHIRMPYSEPPSWLIGRWSCKGLEANGFNGGPPSPPINFAFEANATGRIWSTSGRDETIQIWSYEDERFAVYFSAIFVGVRHGGLEYAVEGRSPEHVQLREAAFYREGEWPALSTQQRWACTRDRRQ
ncbi:MAG: hypothetical protein JOZ24_08750 [Candidatus Eremiobacteraeota bacterium]|nr:hypothetical protein [Candidatus Eremiobacteraeota bacterium]